MITLPVIVAFKLPGADPQKKMYSIDTDPLFVLLTVESKEGDSHNILNVDSEKANRDKSIHYSFQGILVIRKD